MSEASNRGKRKTNPSARDEKGFWKTPLAAKRVEMGVDQKTMSELTGIPLRTYRKLEAGEIENPGIRYLINCAIVLGATLKEVSPVPLDKWSKIRNERAKYEKDAHGPAAPPDHTDYINPRRWEG